MKRINSSNIINLQKIQKLHLVLCTDTDTIIHSWLAYKIWTAAGMTHNLVLTSIRNINFSGGRFTFRQLRLIVKWSRTDLLLRAPWFVRSLAVVLPHTVHTFMIYWTGKMDMASCSELCECDIVKKELIETLSVCAFSSCVYRFNIW